LFEDRNDLRLDLGQRTLVGGLFILNLQDVVAELRLDDARGLSGSQRERRLVELGNGLTAVQPSEFAALVLAAGVVGVLLGQLGEVAASLDLLQQIVGLGLGCRVCLGIGPLGNGDE